MSGELRFVNQKHEPIKIGSVEVGKDFLIVAGP